MNTDPYQSFYNLTGVTPLMAVTVATLILLTTFVLIARSLVKQKPDNDN